MNGKVRKMKSLYSHDPSTTLLEEVYTAAFHIWQADLLSVFTQPAERMVC
jgi:hypothetical protein